MGGMCMNKIYKVIWSKAKNCYVVASEFAKSHTKSPKSGLGKTLVAGILACVLSCGAVMPVFAEGSGNDFSIVVPKANGAEDVYNFNLSNDLQFDWYNLEFLNYLYLSQNGSNDKENIKENKKEISEYIDKNQNSNPNNKVIKSKYN